LAVYNLASSRTAGVSAGSRWLGLDSTMKVIGIIDEYRCVLVIQQGSNTRTLAFGQTARRHIPDDLSGIGTVNGTITGGATTVLTLNQDITAKLTGDPTPQKIW